MAPNVGRWWKYAQAKLNDALASGHRELDQLEAEREADVADKPWLSSDAEAPTFDEARARIEWDASQQQAQATTGADRSPAPGAGEQPPAEAEAGVAADSARLELDRREAEARARLEAIRKELGVDPPTAGPS